MSFLWFKDTTCFTVLVNLNFFNSQVFRYLQAKEMNSDVQKQIDQQWPSRASFLVPL